MGRLRYECSPATTAIPYSAIHAPATNYETMEVLYEAVARPQVHGDTDAERVDNAVRKMFSVPKSAIVKIEAEEKHQREKKRIAKKPQA